MSAALLRHHGKRHVEMLSAMRTIGRATALLTTPAPEPPARGVIEKYRLVKPKSAPRSTESVSELPLVLMPCIAARPRRARSGMKTHRLGVIGECEARTQRLVRSRKLRARSRTTNRACRARPGGGVLRFAWRSNKPARGVIENYPFVKPKSARRSDELAPILEPRLQSR